MTETYKIDYVIHDPIELNMSYMPFIKDGGLFIPSFQAFSLGDSVIVDLQFPAKKETLQIEGSVVWLTPPNALHHVSPGIGIRFTGAHSKTIRAQIESMLDTSLEIGGYTYGITEESKKDKK